jgi:hypothetical protein
MKRSNCPTRYSARKGGKSVREETGRGKEKEGKGKTNLAFLSQTRLQTLLVYLTLLHQPLVLPLLPSQLSLPVHVLHNDHQLLIFPHEFSDSGVLIAVGGRGVGLEGGELKRFELCDADSEGVLLVSNGGEFVLKVEDLLLQDGGIVERCGTQFDRRDGARRQSLHRKKKG